MVGRELLTNRRGTIANVLSEPGIEARRTHPHARGVRGYEGPDEWRDRRYSRRKECVLPRLDERVDPCDGRIKSKLEQIDRRSTSS